MGRNLVHDFAHRHELLQQAVHFLDASRRKRIAAGSGTSVEEVNRLLKQFMQMRKVMHQVSTNPMQMMRSAKANAKAAKRGR